MTIEDILTSEIRVLRLVVDVEDVFNPEVPFDYFITKEGEEPKPPKYRIVTIEVLTCPQDGQPVSIGECGGCRKFIRRLDNKVYCKGITIHRSKSM